MSTSHFWADFERLSLWSVQALMIPPLMALLIICCASFILASIRQRPLSNSAWHASRWLALTQFLFFPAMIAVGVLFPAISLRPHPQVNPVGSRWLDGLFYLSLATGCFWVYRMKGLRWFAVSAIALQELLVLCAGFIAGMSVGGDRL